MGTGPMRYAQQVDLLGTGFLRAAVVKMSLVQSLSENLYLSGLSFMRIKQQTMSKKLSQLLC
jgi:hypothetical protein